MERKVVEYLNFSIDSACSNEHVDLDVHYFDERWGPSSETLDAVEVYNALKDFFKGSEFE